MAQFNPIQVSNPNILGNVQAGLKIGNQFRLGNQQQQAAQKQIEDQAVKDRFASVTNAALTASNLPDDASRVKFLTARNADLESKGIDNSDTREVLELFNAGQADQANALLASAVQTGRDLKILAPQARLTEATKPQPFQKGGDGLVFNPNTGTFAVDPVAKQALAEKAALAIEKANATNGKLDFKDRQSLNKDVTGLIKNTVGITNTAKDLEKLGKVRSGPASIALVFKFMKALDPTSVVREGEFATAENSAGVDEKVRNVFNKLLNGERLGDVQIEQFIETARALSNEAISGSEREVSSMLETFGDTIDDKFKSSLLNRIPKPGKDRAKAVKVPEAELKEGVIIVNPSTGERKHLVNGKWESL